MENAITPAELAADQAAETAMQAHAAFREAHWAYFWAVGRLHPVTGQMVVQTRRDIDRESSRLARLAAAANRHAADVERAARHASA